MQLLFRCLCSIGNQTCSNQLIYFNTPKAVQCLLNEEKTNFIRPSIPVILVNELTKDIIHETIESWMNVDNGY
jgi:hypothetical protein